MKIEMIDYLLRIIPLGVGAIGIFFAWSNRRKSELRKDDVLSWTFRCIDRLETLYLISTLGNNYISSEKEQELRLEILIDTSILVEQGRLFFKNEISDDFGSHKESAYKGYRPIILDKLIIAHQIAREWPDLDELDRNCCSDLALSILKEFVSLAQHEVGRARAASVQAAKAGNGIHLQVLLTQCRENP